MKNLKIIFIVWLGGCLILFTASKVNAEYSFNIPEMQLKTRNASILIFSTISNLFKCFEELERKNFRRADGLRDEMLVSLDKAAEIHRQISFQISKKPITIEKIKPEQWIYIGYDFIRFGLKFPKTKEELANIATSEIMNFRKFISTIKFMDNPVQNRMTIRMLSKRLERLITLGISISEIAALKKD